MFYLSGIVIEIEVTILAFYPPPVKRPEKFCPVRGTWPQDSTYLTRQWVDRLGEKRYNKNWR